jgi:hypothetical protein
MSVEIQYDSNNICLLRISGVLQRAEFGAGQSAIGQNIDAGAQPRVLAILENFEGWERAADGTISILFSRMETRLRRSRSSENRAGKWRHWPLPELASVVRR